MLRTPPSPVHDSAEPSRWVMQGVAGLAPQSLVLDVASGRGRNSRWLAGQGYRVLAVDRDAVALASLGNIPNLDTLARDLENDDWPFEGRHFDAVIVCRYLHRPLLGKLLAAVAPGGRLIYETYMAGNERYGRPRNPDFLLRPGELLELASAADWQVDAWREGLEETIEADGSIRRALTQAIVASRPR